MSLGGFKIRLVFAIVLVLLTYNPSGFSFAHWLKTGFETDLPLKVLAGIVLVIGYVICLRATFRSIGVFGVLLIVALLGAIAWVLFDIGILGVENPGVLQWLSLIGLGIILGVGLSWSHVRRRLAGQADVDDVDE